MNNPPNRFSYFTCIVKWFLILWTGVLALWLYCYSIRQGGIPCWDGFERCAWASHIWYDIRHLDGYHFWRHTNAQVVWPFLHSWITGFFFVIFGPTLACARLVSLLAFGGSACLIFYWFARQNHPLSWLGGVIAWSLFTTSPIVIQQATGIMSEGIGLFFLLLILTSLPEKPNESISRWVGSGLLLGIFFFYKYNFAFLTYFALLVSRFAQGGFTFKGMWKKSNFLLLGIPVFLMVLWFIPDIDQKWKNLVYFVVNNPSARQPWGWSTLFYYPQVIPAAYYQYSWLAVLSAALFLIALPMSRKLSLKNPIVACFVVHFLAAVIHPMKTERFQFLAMGMFFIASGEAVIVILRTMFRKEGVVYRFMIGMSVIALLILCVVIQTKIYTISHLPQEDVYRSPIQAVVDRMHKNDRVAFLITHDFANPPAASYYMMTELDALQRDLRAHISRWHHIFIFSRAQDVVSKTAEERLKILRHELFLTRTNKIAIIENTDPTSSPIFPSVFSGVHEYIQLVPQLQEFQLEFQREFPRAKARVRIYTMKEFKL